MVIVGLLSDRPVNEVSNEEKAIAFNYCFDTADYQFVIQHVFILPYVTIIIQHAENGKLWTEEGVNHISPQSHLDRNTHYRFLISIHS